MKLLILFGLFAVTVGLSLPSQRILVGQETTISDIPWQVSIQFLGHVCSGSVIAPRWVLTTASCVAGLSEEATQIRWGSSFHNQGGNMVSIEDFHINTNYNRRTFQADIALIKTVQVINAQPVPLANSADLIIISHPVVISGWGITSRDHGEFSQTLRKATIPYITLARCRPYYESLNVNLPADMFCAGDPANGGAGICRGDIGGPATFLNDDGDGIRRLFGIASFTLTCGGVGQPSVFTDVRPYRTWIKEVSGV